MGIREEFTQKTTPHTVGGKVVVGRIAKGNQLYLRFCHGDLNVKGWGVATAVYTAIYYCRFSLVFFILEIEVLSGLGV